MGVQDAEVPHSQYQLVEEDIVPVVSAVPGGWGETRACDGGAVQSNTVELANISTQVQGLGSTPG